MKKTNASLREAASPQEDPTVPFMAAMKLHMNNMLNAAFAHRALSVALIASTVSLLQLPVNAWLIWKVANPPVKYFATYKGSVLEQFPTDKPGYSDDDIIDFGDKLIRDAFQIDFKNYRTQMNAQQQKFSEGGFSGYYSAMTGSNLFASITTKKLLMSANVTRKGVIYRRGVENSSGLYVWDVQYPVTLSLDGQTHSLPAQSFIFTVRIQRTDVSVKPQGIEADAIVTRDAR